jgi:hypothetical protein
VSAPAGRVLWEIVTPASWIACVVAASCGGFELVVEQGGEALARESYPDASTAYERARVLRREYDETVGRMSDQPYLVTATCAVRPWRMSDAPSIARHADNPKIGRNLRDGFPSPYTVEAGRDFIQRARASAALPVRDRRRRRGRRQHRVHAARQRRTRVGGNRVLPG